MSALAHEFKHALRGTASRPGFSMLVVGVLAMGLACVIFMLILIGSLVMRPLPFPNADRLQHVGIESGNSHIGRFDPMRGTDLLQLRRSLDGIAEVSGFEGATINLSDLDRPERFDGATVTGNLFKVLQVAPQLGRDFSLADEKQGAPAVVMLSHALWTSRYGADPGVIGRQVRVNARVATVVGVMPPDFSYPRREMIWVPGQLGDGIKSGDTYDVVIRRAPDVGVTAVRTALEAWFDDAARNEPEVFHRARIAVEPLAYLAVHAGTRSVLKVMLVSTLLVLLIACANAANLLLTRTLARQHELAIRVALGADRRRLAMHLIAQSLVLALIASAIALLLASFAANWVDQAFRATADGPPFWIHLKLDANIVLMTLGAGMLTALIAGLLPALRAGGSAMAGHLRDSTRTTGGASGRISRVLMVGEVALSLTLLIAVGALVRNVMALDRPDLGIDPKGILTARVALFENVYPTGAEQVRVFERIVDRLRADPDVVDATAATNLPGLDGWTRKVIADGQVADHDAALPITQFASVDDSYLSTYAIRLVDGRFFDSRDSADSTPVAVVDQRFVDRYGASEGVIGRRFRLDPDSADQALVTIVGVVSSLRLDSPIEAPSPSLLTPLRQQPARYVSLAIRTRSDPGAFAPRLVEAIRSIDADTPAYWVRTYEQVIRQSSFDFRLLAGLFGTFGLLALALAAAGLFGVIAFNVGQRTREIGVRRALGASSGTVLRNVLALTGWQMGLGIALGLGLGLALTRVLNNSMHGIPGDIMAGNDALSVIAALGVLLLAATVAVVLPVRRALRIDPMVALRHE
jgi:putative ABC transport system permease protein